MVTTRSNIEEERYSTYLVLSELEDRSKFTVIPHDNSFDSEDEYKIHLFQGHLYEAKKFNHDEYVIYGEHGSCRYDLKLLVLLFDVCDTIGNPL